MHHAFKAIVPAARHGLWNDSPIATTLQATAKAVSSLCLRILATRKRVYIFSERHLLCRLIFRQLVSDIRFYRVTVCSRCVNIISSAPKMTIPVLILQIRMTVKYHLRTLPFLITLNCETLKLGGILTSKWIWSEHASAAWISTFFKSQSCLNILPISVLSWL